MRSPIPLVGRVGELQRLRHAAAEARSGTPAAVLVYGEPGVGKTRLVTEVTSELGEQGFTVLLGRCVRFAAEASSYLPIAQALGPRLKFVVAGPQDGLLLHRVGAAVEELMAAAPVALVIDDLQWADLSSLDVLTYLVAGFAPGQRLLLLATYRDTELATGHRLHGWLSDIRRMPGVSRLKLERFDRRDTELLVDALLNARENATLADQAFDRSNGNAYLTELLVCDLDPSDDQLPAALPGDLREALLAAWHRLSAPTRTLMQVLAVGGMPVEVEVLGRVARVLGLNPGEVSIGAVEAVDAGLAVIDGDGSVWFHHPLVADVLVSTLIPSDAARFHATYSTVWLAADRAPQHVRAAHLALHSEAAGAASAALTWSVRAAEEAERVRGYAEEARHLARACRMWPEADEGARADAGDYLGLVLRATHSAHRAGDFDTAVSLGERAYQLATDRGDPLESCRVLVELNLLRALQSLDWSIEPLREAVRLSSAYPQSGEHARAVAELAFFELWHGLPDAAHHATEALAIARLCGSEQALAHALQVAANTRWSEPDSLLLAEEAVVVSRRTGDAVLITHAAIAWSNCVESLGQAAEAGPFLLEIYNELNRSGAPHQAAIVATVAAQLLMVTGHWGRSRDLLREALPVKMPNQWRWHVRLFSAELAVRCGQLSNAEQHLRRAKEIAAHADLGPDFTHTPVTAALLTAQHRFSEAVAVITAEIETIVKVDPRLGDELMMWAAAATADLCEQDRSQSGTAISSLDRLEGIRGAQLPGMFLQRVSGDPYPLAHGALYVAHRSRTAGHQGGSIEAWAQAVQACDLAGLPWEAAQARYRLAAALVLQRGSRSRAGTALRAGWEVASRLGAAPLAAEIEALAAQAHLSLTEPASDDLRSDRIAALHGLTRREQEVLGLLLAGRTYAEIATELFISEKTVSVHVSNLLRKTGTASRIELTARVRSHTTAQI